MKTFTIDPTFDQTIGYLVTEQAYHAFFDDIEEPHCTVVDGGLLALEGSEVSKTSDGITVTCEWSRHATVRIDRIESVETGDISSRSHNALFNGYALKIRTFSGAHHLVVYLGDEAADAVFALEAALIEAMRG